MSRAPMPSPDQLLSHTNFVRAMARGVLGGDDLVEDAVQETWLAVLHGGRARPGKLRSWLGSVGRRRALDLHRRESTRKRYEHAAPESARETDTSELAARAEIGRNMTSALLALDDKYREALLLRYYEDLPPREIAAKLDLPVETVRTRIKRGLDKIRAHLDKEHGDVRQWRAVLGGWFSSPAGLATALSPVAVVLLLLLIGGLSFGAYAGIRALSDASSEAGSSIGDVRDTGDGTLTLSNRDRPILLPGVAKPDDGDEAAPKSGGEESAKRFTIRGRIVDAKQRPVDGMGVSWAVMDRLPKPRVDEDGNPEEPPAPVVPAGEASCGAACGGRGCGAGAPGHEDVPKRLGDGTVYTNARGRYEIKNVPGGSLALAVPSEGGFGKSLALRHWIDADLEHDFHLHGDLVYAGVVEAPGDGPIEMWLDYRTIGAGGISWARWGVRKLTLTGDRTFRLNGMRPGVYDVHLKGEGVEKYENEIDVTKNRQDERIVLRASVSAKGRVVLPEGFDPKSTWLWVRPVEGPFQQQMIDVADDGTFEIKGLPAAKYRVFVRNTTETPRDDDYHAWTTERELVISVTGEPIVIDIEGDEQVGLRVRLPADVNGVRGHVDVVGNAAGEEPVGFRAARADDGSIEVRPSEFSHAFPPPVERTDKGDMWLKGMPKGVYTVRVVVPGFETVEKELEVGGPAVVEVELVRSEGRVVKAENLDRLYTIDARPASGGDWKTLLWQDARARISHTPIPGVFQAFLEPGAYVFRVISLHYAPYTSKPVTIESSAQPLVLDFDLPNGAAISGTVRQGEGNVETLLHVFHEQPDGTWKRMPHKETGVDSDDGKYEIKGLAPGRYRLSMSQSGSPHLKELVLGEADLKLDLAVDR